MRIFIGPTEIAGIAHGLSQGFSRIGVVADVVLSSQHRYGYGNSASGWLFRCWKKIGLLTQADGNAFRKYFYLLCYKFLSIFVLIYSACIYDAFIYLFGDTITGTRAELSILRFLKKKIIFVYVGSDARPPFINGGFFQPPDGDADLHKILCLAKRYKSRILLHEKYADYIVNSPFTAQYQERRFINWFNIGIPRALDDGLRPVADVSERVRVLHSPSNPHIKGSDAIAGAIDRLTKKGYEIDFVKIDGLPNERVLDELARCDFVVDQLYSDTPLAVFAAEAAHYGKPAIVGGYSPGQLDSFLNADEVPPSLFVLPEYIEAAIEKMMVDKPYRLALGERARRFVVERWSPKDVAQRYMRLIADDVPESWWFDPQKVTYAYGCGMSQEQAARIVRTVIDEYGVGSLLVADKPELEKAFIALAYGANSDG